MSLLRSRKFLAAVLGVVVVIAVHFGVDEAKAKQIADWVGVLLAAYIGGTALEDAAGKRANGNGGGPPTAGAANSG